MHALAPPTRVLKSSVRILLPTPRVHPDFGREQALSSPVLVGQLLRTVPVLSLSGAL